MRAVLLVLILVVLIALGAIATGFININQTQSARAPDVDANRAGVSASGGQAPQFDVETGKIAVGARERTIKLPSIEVRPANGGQQPANGQSAGHQGSGTATTNSTQP